MAQNTDDNDDALKQLNDIDPITEDAVQFRVEADIVWPEELEGEGADWAWSERKAFDLAASTFAGYRAARAAHAQNKRLSPEGARAADVEWVEERLPALAKHAETLREKAKGLEDQLARMADTALRYHDDDDGSVKPAEIRHWMMTVPERERADRALALIRKGDRLVLRTNFNDARMDERHPPG